jgi:LCP family protein required for cell wall assembly
MALCINPQLQRAVMVTLPRDLLVTIPEVPKGVQSYPQKLGHAYAFGGAPLSEKTAARETGLTFDYYAEINQDDFIKVVDMLGGVDINVPDYEGQGRGMNYDDSWGDLHCHLKPGLQHLNGRQAQGFVRYRHSNLHAKGGGLIGIGDFQRGGNQQVFLKAMIEQKAHVSNLPNLMRAAAFIMQHLQTDMDWRTLVGLALVAKNLDTNHILHLVVPAQDKMINRVYYCAATPAAMEQMRGQIDAYLAGTSSEAATGNMPFLQKEIGSGPAESGGATGPTPVAAAAAPAGPFRVRILNGSGAPGAAKLAAAKIKSKDAHLASVGNADRYNYTQTIVEYLPGQQAAAQQVAVALGLPAAPLQQVTADPAAPGVAVTVVVGQDFLSVVPPASAKNKAAGRHKHP